MGLTLSWLHDEDPTVQQKSLEQFWKRMESLGGPKLLERSQKVGDDEEEEEDPDGPVEVKESKTSFLSDRRIMRLIVARYWADQLQKRFLKETQPPTLEVPDTLRLGERLWNNTGQKLSKRLAKTCTDRVWPTRRNAPPGRLNF